MANSVVESIQNVISNFTFFYPVFMSIVWIIGGLSYWHKNEYKTLLPPSEGFTPLTILIPCHNEGKTIEHTCRNLSALEYPRYNVIFIDDGSTDDTVDIIREYTNTIPNYHLLIIEENKGKANALNIALKLVRTRYVLVMDADTVLSKDALKYFTAPFMYNDDLGAVTGNPIPMNRNSILAKLQTAEFMSIIGLIKRTQHIFGQIFTVSGCATAYRTEILKKVQGFSSSTATEDIDITWKIQRIGKHIYFEPKAAVFIQVPDSFKEYWSQRKRWAKGGWHMLRTHKNILTQSQNNKLKILYLDFSIGCLWCFCFAFTLIAYVSMLFFSQPLITGFSLIWHSSIAISFCIIQLFIAIKINKPYDATLSETFIWVPWYALVFFMVSAFLVVLTSPKGLFGNLKGAGKWSSPTRSIK